MATCRRFARVDVGELKLRLVKRLGRQKANKYFLYLTRLLNLKVTKLEFDKLCCATIGRENIGLHNSFISAIIRNALAGVPPPSRQAATGHSGTTTAQSGRFGGAMLPPSGNVGVVGDFGDGKAARERPVVGKVLSVEDGEEVEQVRSAQCVQSWSPIVAPLGIPKVVREDEGTGRLHGRLVSCYDSGQLLDTEALCKGLERRLQNDGIGVAVQCVDALNHGLDEFLRRLIRPCVDLSRARSSEGRISQSNGKITAGMKASQRHDHGVGDHCTSLQDFVMVLESNPHLLGINWPTQLEKIRTMSFGE